MKGSRRRSSDRWAAFDGGEHIPVPDFAVFRSVCDDVGKKLGIKGSEVYRLYKAYISCSVELLFPENKPGELTDEELLTPRRRIQIPHVASLEVTENSLRRWRIIQRNIRNKRNKDTEQTNKDTEC